MPSWFDHLEERFSYKEVHFKKFCSPVKTICPVAERVTETPAHKESSLTCYIARKAGVTFESMILIMINSQTLIKQPPPISLELAA